MNNINNNNNPILQFNNSNVYFLYGVGRINIFESDETNRQQNHQQQQHLNNNGHHQNINYNSSLYYGGSGGSGQNSSMFINNCSQVDNKNIITPIKSTIIAKKTKFWKYLEEEKLKKKSIIENKCDRKRIKNESATDNNNTNNLLDINFMGCTLGITGSDHCRCMDCQSRYFECDEDSYDSEFYDFSNSGYMNPVSSQSSNPKNFTTTKKLSSDPPSYENGLESEKLLMNLDFGSRLTISTAEDIPSSSSDNCENLIHNTEQISSSTPNISPSNNSQQHQEQNQQQQLKNNTDNNDTTETENLRKNSLDSAQYLISTMTTTPSSQENLIDGDDCTGSCEPLFNTSSICDIENEHENYPNCAITNEENNLNDDVPQLCFEDDEQNESNDHYDDNSYINYSQQQQQQHQHHQQIQQVISNKSSKKIYKAVAKQWGITCKMNDQCRCMDCQSNYFDCEYDQNDHHKSDGGLGATTPMFISEVMHGSACCIL